MAGDKIAAQLDAGMAAEQRRREQSGAMQYLGGSQEITSGPAMDKVAASSEFAGAVAENPKYFYDEFIPRMARFEHAKSLGWDLNGDSEAPPSAA